MQDLKPGRVKAIANALELQNLVNHKFPSHKGLKCLKYLGQEVLIRDSRKMELQLSSPAPLRLFLEYTNFIEQMKSFLDPIFTFEPSHNSSLRFSMLLKLCTMTFLDWRVRTKFGLLDLQDL